MYIITLACDPRRFLMLSRISKQLEPEIKYMQEISGAQAV